MQMKSSLKLEGMEDIYTLFLTVFVGVSSYLSDCLNFLVRSLP